MLHFKSLQAIGVRDQCRPWLIFGVRGRLCLLFLFADKLAAPTGLAPACTRLKVSPHDYLAFEAMKGSRGRGCTYTIEFNRFVDYCYPTRE
jgi:hypothetical protein